MVCALHEGRWQRAYADMEDGVMTLSFGDSPVRAADVPGGWLFSLAAPQEQPPPPDAPRLLAVHALVQRAQELRVAAAVVLAVYALQTDEEKRAGRTLVRNGVGFSRHLRDDETGSRLAEQLLGGEHMLCKKDAEKLRSVAARHAHVPLDSGRAEFLLAWEGRGPDGSPLRVEVRV